MHVEREDTEFVSRAPTRSTLVYMAYASPPRRGWLPRPPHLTTPLALEHQPPLFILLPLRATPACFQRGGVSPTHRTANIGRVVDTRGPSVGAVAVGGDESVLLRIPGAAVDLVFPAWLWRTFYPRAARDKRVIAVGKKTFLPPACPLNTKDFLRPLQQTPRRIKTTCRPQSLLQGSCPPGWANRNTRGTMGNARRHALMM